MEGGESPADIIVKKLSIQRMEELEKILEQEKAEILKLEEQTELLSRDDITEEQLQHILKVIKLYNSFHFNRHLGGGSGRSRRRQKRS